jgi:hypothetical protein
LLARAGDRLEVSTLAKAKWTPEIRCCPTCSTDFTQHRYGQVYCTPECRPRRDSWRNATRQPKASTTERGYDSRHKALRAQWKPKVDALEVDCWRCGKRIVPDSSLKGDGWDLGHDDRDRTQYRGPEHVGCNRRTKAHAAAKTLIRRTL